MTPNTPDAPDRDSDSDHDGPDPWSREAREAWKQAREEARKKRREHAQGGADRESEV